MKRNALKTGSRSMIAGLALVGSLLAMGWPGGNEAHGGTGGNTPTQARTIRSGRQIAQSTFPSTVLLLMDDANGQPVSLGSGFFVTPAIVATNLHVIEGAVSGYAKIVGQKARFEVRGIVAMDSQKDLALLSIAGASARPLEFGDSGKATVGDEVYAVGNPEGLEGTFSQGIISGIRHLDSGTLLQITAPISPGSSGGPVLNNEGKVIGVAAATLTDGQNLNFAIPGAYVASLLSQRGPITPLSAVRDPSSRKSSLTGFGNSNAEAITGAQFNWNTRSTGASFDYYTFSLRNSLAEAVQDVYCLVIFYDSDGKPVDANELRYNTVIPAGLAKRVEGRVDPSVFPLATSFDDLSKLVKTRVEVRILDFRIVE